MATNVLPLPHGGGVELGRGIPGRPSDLWIVGHTESARGDASRAYVVRLDASGLAIGGGAR